MLAFIITAWVIIAILACSVIRVLERRDIIRQPNVGDNGHLYGLACSWPVVAVFIIIFIVFASPFFAVGGLCKLFDKYVLKKFDEKVLKPIAELNVKKWILSIVKE